MEIARQTQGSKRLIVLPEYLMRELMTQIAGAARVGRQWPASRWSEHDLGVSYVALVAIQAATGGRSGRGTKGLDPPAKGNAQHIHGGMSHG